MPGDEALFDLVLARKLIEHIDTGLTGTQEDRRMLAATASALLWIAAALEGGDGGAGLDLGGDLKSVGARS